MNESSHGLAGCLQATSCKYVGDMNPTTEYYQQKTFDWSKGSHYPKPYEADIDGSHAWWVKVRSYQDHRPYSKKQIL